MSRFYLLLRLLILVLIFTLVTTTLSIQAAPLPQTAGPDRWTPRGRDAENMPHWPGAERPAVTSKMVEATALYPWSRLAFQSLRVDPSRGNWEIYVGNDDGSGQTRLTFDNSLDIEPRLNRGATRIAFTSKRTGNYEIYTMNIDGTGLTQLTSNNTDDVMPYWSPDGSKIAFQAYRDGQAEIYVMNADGSGQIRLTNNSGYDGEPAWSPNSAKIAFTSQRTGDNSDRHIWVMDANGSNQAQLTPQAKANCSDPVWSPDGTKIAYNAATIDYGWPALWVMNADGSSPQVIVNQTVYSIIAWARSWSPDGRYVAFTRAGYHVLHGELYWAYAYLEAWDSTTGNIVRLSNNGSDWHPDWQTTDIAAPTSSVNTLPAASPTVFTVSWSGSDPGASGLKNFDIQVKDGANGAWTIWQNQTTATLAPYSGIGGHTYYFRSRARDNAGNVEDWPTNYDAFTWVDTTAPTSAVETLPEFSKDTVVIKWSGTDPDGSGIQSYDVQYRDVTTGGAWTNWQMAVATTTASFAGTTGHTYAFRSRALDYAQNQEDWPSGSGDAHTTFYIWAISGTANTNTGSPVVGVNVTTQPSAQGVFATDLSGLYSAYVITPSDTYTVSWPKSGYGSLPATIFEEPVSTAMVSQGTLPAQGDIVTVSGLKVGQTYRIVVTGAYQFAGASGALADAQWIIAGHCTPGVFCQYNPNISVNGVLLAAQNGQDTVDPNHEYTFLWLADATQLQIHIMDSVYFDNSGSLAFEIFNYQADNDPNVFLPPADDVILNGHFEQGTGTINNWIASGVPTPTVSIAARHTGRQSAFLRTTAPLTLENGLVAYWKLDETSGMRSDATGRGNNLLDSTLVTSATGKLGKAAQFVAANHQYLNLANNADLSTGDIDFTVAGWVYLDAPKTNGVIVAKGDATTFGTLEYGLGYAAPQDRFAISVGDGTDGGATVFANTFGSPTANQWYFVAFWHDSANNQLGISVNGVSNVISYSGGVADGSHEFRLGDDLDGRWWNGRLDEIGFWKRVLTPRELATLYNNGWGLAYPFNSFQFNSSTIAQAVTIPETMTNPILSFLYQPSGISALKKDLVSYWKLDEADGNALDVLGTNPLTATNAPGSTTGVIQGARTFSGDHQYFFMPSRPSVEVGNTSVTFTAWVSMTDKYDHRNFIGKQIEVSDTNRDYSLYYDVNFDRFIFQVAGPDGVTLTRAMANSLGSPQPNRWYFLAGGYDLTNGYVWISVNGDPRETTPFTGTVHVGPAPLMLGGVANPYYGYQSGLMDEVGFWKRALTSQEVASLYNNGQGLSYPFNSSDPKGVLDVQIANGITTTTIFTTDLDAMDWTHQWLALSDWKGQTITLTFVLHGLDNSPASVYLDEVTLGSGYPDVWVQLANLPIARPGSTVSYQLTYGNQAGVPASDVQLTVTLPAQLTFLSASVPPTSPMTSLVWDLGELPAQSGPQTILITAAVTSTISHISTLSNTASINTATTELEMVNNTYQTNLLVKYDIFLPLIARE